MEQPAHCIHVEPRIRAAVAEHNLPRTITALGYATEGFQFVIQRDTLDPKTVSPRDGVTAARGSTVAG